MQCHKILLYTAKFCAQKNLGVCLRGWQFATVVRAMGYEDDEHQRWNEPEVAIHFPQLYKCLAMSKLDFRTV